MSPEQFLSELCGLTPGVDAVPTDNPKWWVMTQPCGVDCHHPVHAFHPERRAHLIEVPPFETRIFGKVVK